MANERDKKEEGGKKTRDVLAEKRQLTGRVRQASRQRTLAQLSKVQATLETGTRTLTPEDITVLNSCL